MWMFYCSINKHHASSTENNKSFLPQNHHLANVLSQLSLAETKLSDKISPAEQDFESQLIWTWLSTTPVNIFLTSSLIKLNCLTSCSTHAVFTHSSYHLPSSVDSWSLISSVTLYPTLTLPLQTCSKRCTVWIQTLHSLDPNK